MLKDLETSAKTAWWLVVVMGVASIIFGAVVLFMPGLSLATFIALFAIVLFVEGVVEVVYGLSAIKKDSSWWLSLLFGVLLVAVSVYVIRNPALSALAFALVAGWVLVIRGIFETIFAFTLDRGLVREVLLGMLSVAAGIAILAAPVQGVMVLTWLLGLYALVNGVILFGSALTARAEYRAIAASYTLRKQTT